jgi:hypothetical protein
MNMVMNLEFYEERKFVDQLNDCHLFEEDSVL